MKKSLKQRKLSKKITAWFVFGAICLVFVFFGLPQQMGLSTGGAIAVVNNEIISIAQFRTELSNLEQRFGAQSNDAMKQFIQQQALQGLISREVLYQSAYKLGMRVSDEEVRDIIINQIDFFKEDGRFQKQRYDNYLNYMGLSAGDFEKQLRRQSLIQKSSRMFQLGVQTLDVELEKQKHLQEQEINLSFVKLSRDELGKNIKITKAEIEKRMQLEDFEQKVKSYFESHSSEFIDDEQVRAQHILIKAKKGNQEEENKAKEKITAIQKRLESEEFSQVAQELSEDVGSASKGGDLGFFGRGKMVPEFENVAFNSAPDQISEPVQSQFGFHLIKVLEKKERQTKVFDDVKYEIAEKLFADEMVFQVLVDFETSVKNNNTVQLNQLIKKYGIKWEETDFFSLDSLSIPKIGENEKIFSAAFSLEKNKIFPELLNNNADQYIVKLKEKRKKDLKELDGLLEQVNQERENEAFTGWLSHCREEAKIQQNDKVLGTPM